jgi:hypothetical protein
MRTVEQDKQEMTEVIEQYRRGFATLDVATLTAMWDQSYAHIISIPLEPPTPSGAGQRSSNTTSGSPVSCGPG